MHLVIHGVSTKWSGLNLVNRGLGRHSGGSQMELTCKYCRKIFTRPTGALETQKRFDPNAGSYCSRHCTYEGRKKASRIQRACLKCGVVIWAYTSQAGNAKSDRRYCSKKCADKDSRTIRICPRCGVAFNYFQSVPRKYCSLTCSGKAKTDLKRDCAACGTIFTYPPARAGSAKFCSFKCKVVFEGAARRKDWPGKRLYYTLEWLTLRKKILDRDGHRCARCGSTEKLQVHHKNPYCASRDNAEDNLVTLCKPCHFIVEYRLKTEFGGRIAFDNPPSDRHFLR